MSNHLWKNRFSLDFDGTAVSVGKAVDIQMLTCVFEEETVTLDW